MSDILTPDQAEALAARTLAAIDSPAYVYVHDPEVRAADRERVASDLAGLTDLYYLTGEYDELDRAVVRFADGLRRTAALYGVTP